MKKTIIALLLIIGFSQSIIASTGAQQAKSLVMVVGSVIVMAIFSIKKKK
jgi:hypothetical protein